MSALHDITFDQLFPQIDGRTGFYTDIKIVKSTSFDIELSARIDFVKVKAHIDMKKSFTFMGERLTYAIFMEGKKRILFVKYGDDDKNYIDIENHAKEMIMTLLRCIAMRKNGKRAMWVFMPFSDEDRAFFPFAEALNEAVNEIETRAEAGK